MTLEKELKFLDVDHDELRQRLEKLGANRIARYFESNLVLDDYERSLKGQGVLLRLRKKQGVAVLTVKEPASMDLETALKVYDEHETEVADHDAMLAGLEAIGYHVAFAYEKVREKWTYEHCTICLDLLPFGAFAELEGGEGSVLACAGELQMDISKKSTATYHELNRTYREAAGLEPEENFTFSDEERRQLFELLDA